ncbi:MAG: pitrilysin family protein [Bacteroidales bacterium]|nr:pitrilysin family protein [Bacteroidales bacterium]
MLERNIQPHTSPISSINIPEPEKIITPNGVEIFQLNLGDQDVFRIDVIFGAGKWEQKKNLVAMFTNLLLKEGVEGMSALEVAEHLDYYGAWLQPSATYHNSYVTLYSLNKYAKETLSLVEKIIKKPLFNEHEFDVIRNRRKQSFLVEEEKVQVVAFNNFIEAIFGKVHPYGKHASASDFDILNTDDLKEFHKKYYNSSNCKIVITGKITDEIMDYVINAFGKEQWGGMLVKDRLCEQETSDDKDVSNNELFCNYENSYKPKEIFVEKADAMQSAIRIGMPVINRNHPDYAKLRILNTLLGGYFGSRLMANIREEKGYTYGIGSNITTLKNGSYITISTQTAVNYTQEVIKEVFNEIRKLKEELVTDEEMSMLKGYLMGEMARLFDGPFPIADAHISLIANGMDSGYYKNMIKEISDITSGDIIEMAKKYFIENNFSVIISGKKE